jgi:hypothetical protein
MLQRLALVGLLLAAALVPGCVGNVNEPQPPETWQAEAWPAGQSIFESDPSWLGGDGAQTIALGDDRILWLFGDSVVDPSGDRGPSFVHNTVAIQQGSNPSNASFDAAWGTETRTNESQLPEPVGTDTEQRRATAFLPNESSEVWYWPAGPAIVEDELIVFANRVRDAGEGAFGFEAAGWQVFEVDGYEQAPEEWRIESVNPQIEDYNFTVGISTLVERGHLYAYGQRATNVDGLTVHEVGVARWSLEDIREGRWDRVEWWTGEAWSGNGTPAVVVETLAASFTVDRIDDRVVLTALEGFPTGNVTLRAGAAPQGPFSQPVIAHQPDRNASQDHGHYAARSHPELTGGKRILTWHDSRFDRPRMARLPAG